MATEAAKDYSDIFRRRWLEPDLQSFLEGLWPHEDSRQQMAKYAANSLTTVHAMDPGLWGLSRLKDLGRLNFGRMEAVAMIPNGLCLMVDLRTLEQAGTLAAVDRHIRYDYGPFKTAPGSRYVVLTPLRSKDLESLYGLIRPAHLWHLQMARHSSINGKTRSSHHPGLVDAIARLTGITLAQPEYVRMTRQRATSEHS